jgi:hypothetical protein
LEALSLEFDPPPAETQKQDLGSFAPDLPWPTNIRGVNSTSSFDFRFHRPTTSAVDIPQLDKNRFSIVVGPTGSGKVCRAYLSL